MNQILPVEGNVVSGNDRETIEKIHFISLVKGFSRLFWGLALTAVLFLSQARLEIFYDVRLPAYFLGTALHCWGLLTLRNAGKISARWNLCLALAILLALSQIYFFPFMHWWKIMPNIPFFTLNVGALVASVILSLYLSNIIAADLFRRLSLRAEKLEAQIYAVAVMVFMALPLFIAVVFSSASAMRFSTVFLDEFIEVAHRVPIWLFFLITIPYSLTLAVLWKARDRSYQQFCKEKVSTKPALTPRHYETVGNGVAGQGCTSSTKNQPPAGPPVAEKNISAL